MNYSVKNKQGVFKADTCDHVIVMATRSVYAETWIARTPEGYYPSMTLQVRSRGSAYGPSKKFCPLCPTREDAEERFITDAINQLMTFITEEVRGSVAEDAKALVKALQDHKRIKNQTTLQL